MKSYFFLPLFLLMSSIIFAQNETEKEGSHDYQNTDLDFEIRAKILIDQMTLDEKISQLGNVSTAIPRLGIDQYDWWNECLHGVARAGVATVFPQAIGMAASFDRNTMFDVANVISDEARAKHHEALRNNDYSRYKGLTFWSPNVNIFRDPRWGRGHETYGEDPYLTGQMGIQFVQGLQGNDDKYLKVVATAKHFAVHNGPEADRHVFNVVPSSRDLWETYLPAFHDLIVDAKAYSVMSAYNRVDGESSSASWMLLEDILRKQWDFEGYVVSDCGAIHDIWANHKVVNTAPEAAAIGVRRGCDLNCGGVYHGHLLKAVNEGLITEDEIDVSVYRLMLARMKLGMFDPAEIVPYAQIPASVNNSQAHSDEALEMAQKSMTLLKNDDLLPLNKSKIKTIAVIGPNADSEVALRANYFGEASNPITVLEGIQKAVGENVNILYAQACPINGEAINTNFRTIAPQFLSTKDTKGKIKKGLKGEYFHGRNLEGEPALMQIDEQIKMNWGGGSPTTTAIAQGILQAQQKIDNDNFSIRWTGKLKAPQTGQYTLGITSDDGGRLYINDELIVNGWSDHGMELHQGTIELEGGKEYDIKVEYYEAYDGSGIELLWETPTNDKQNKGGKNEPFSDMLELVAKADITIFVGGLDADWEGEEMANKATVDGFYKGDRTKIELPKVQLEAIQAIQKTGKPMVLVLMAGSSIAFNDLEKNIPAILMGWYPGQRGGEAIANVLFGDYNPAGRLPVTFYSSTNDLADFADYNMSAGKGQTYRYFKGTPLYPFGHGLSYSTFKYSNLTIDKRALSTNDKFNVTVSVKNTGKYDGEEVVQLYIKDVKSDKYMPRKQLRGFERVTLKKGETKTITFTLNAEKDLRYYNSFIKAYEVELGAFDIQIGASSEDIRIKDEVTVH